VTQIINLYGGPGTGKSTSAAYMYAFLKDAGVNVELVREYVKDWAWEGRPVGTYDQLYLLGKQIKRESLLYGKVDVIVTDSPVLLGIYYSERYSPPAVADGVWHAARSFYRQGNVDGHTHHHVFLRRSKPYNPAGRYQTEEEARLIDGAVKDLVSRLVSDEDDDPCSFTDSETTPEALREVLVNLGLLETPRGE
jgi:hypothetical protein